MLKNTNINGIKETAKMMLHMPARKTPFDFIIDHPVFESPFWPDNDGIVDISKSNEAFEKACKFQEDRIERIENALMIMYIFRQPYYLTFLKLSKKYWSDNDFSEALAEAWISEENPNGDANVPTSMSARWFRKAKKTILMNLDEYVQYTSLPESFEIYRGVAPGRNPDGMSWTQSLDGAEWFSNRFGEGYVIKGIAYKKDVLAYFSRRNEAEIVIPAKDVQNKTILKK